MTQYSIDKCKFWEIIVLIITMLSRYFIYLAIYIEIVLMCNNEGGEI